MKKLTIYYLQTTTNFDMPNENPIKPIEEDVEEDTNKYKLVDSQDKSDLLLEMTSNDNEKKSERVLRHAIRSEIDEPLQDNEQFDSSNPTVTDGEQETTDSTIQPQTFLPTTDQTVIGSETTTVSPAEKPPKTNSPNNWHNVQGLSTTSSIPTEWLGYYDYGVHKPEFIEHLEFTTEYSLDNEDIHYVKHELPFKPSLPDYPYTFYTDFFVPMKYFKR